ATVGRPASSTAPRTIVTSQNRRRAITFLRCSRTGSPCLKATIRLEGDRRAGCGRLDGGEGKRQCRKVPATRGFRLLPGPDGVDKGPEAPGPIQIGKRGQAHGARRPVERA